MSYVGLNYIGGQWVPARAGRTLEDRNPADFTDLLGEVARSDADDVAAAVAAAKGAGAKVTLLLENGDYFQTAVLEYSGGARYPHLERVSSTPDRLGDIFRPRAGK